MTTITSFIKRHPLLTYFALTFAISWGGVLLVIGGPGAIPGNGEATEALLPLVSPGDVPRTQRGRHPLDRSRLWQDGAARVALAVAPVAGGRSLVRGRAPARPALVMTARSWRSR